MKRQIVVILVLFFLGTLSWGQGTKEPFDVWKSRVELDIMQEILNTTLKSFTQNLQKESLNLQFSNLSSFYLAGQGAVFVIPKSELRTSPFGNHPVIVGSEFSERMSDLNRQTMELSREAAALAARVGVFQAREPVPIQQLLVQVPQRYQPRRLKPRSHRVRKNLRSRT